MNWYYRKKLRTFLYSNFWLAPTLSIFAAIAVARMLRHVDDSWQWRGFEFTPDGARQLLGSFVSSMLTFLVLVVSSLLLVVQLASAQLTPRIIAVAFREPVIRIALTLFMFSYVLSINLLGRIDQNVPQFALAVTVVFNVAGLCYFLYFVGAMGMSLRPVSVLTRTAVRGRQVIRELYPLAFDATSPHPEQVSPPALGKHAAELEHTSGSGVLLAFDTAGLVAFAQKHQAVIEQIPRVGDFVAPGELLFRIYCRGSVDPAPLRTMFQLGAERTIEQDPPFAFRIIVDIACKALSPAINDPTTAVLAIDQLFRLLRWVGQRQLDSGFKRDSTGALRLVFPTPAWEEYVSLATAEIRQCAGNSIRVYQRLHGMLEKLIRSLPEARSGVLREELRLLTEAVNRNFPDRQDREEACDNTMSSGEVSSEQPAAGASDTGARLPTA